MMCKQCKKCAFNRKSGCVRIGPTMSLLGMVKGQKICRHFSPLITNRLKKKSIGCVLMSRKGIKKHREML